MPTSSLAQNASTLLERRIIELLTSTNLTFKEIILKLDGENLSASIGIIRRINRDNRYRRPRYDSKLTPAQRESLVEELRDHQGVKPNLSLLAKRYGVCHGSVWYWWDKLNRIKRCDSHLSKSSYKTKSLFKRSHQLHMLSSSLDGKQTMGDQDDRLILKARSSDKLLIDSHKLTDQYNLVGRVSLVTSDPVSIIELPILMFSSSGSSSDSDWPSKVASSALSSASTTSASSTASLSPPAPLLNDTTYLAPLNGDMYEFKRGALGMVQTEA